MAGTAIVAHPIYMEHDTGPGHPETSERLNYIYRALEESGLTEAVRKIEPRKATAEELARIHSPGHIERIKSTAGVPRSWMDGDTPTSAESYEAALLAAGGLLELTDAVICGDVDNGFALVRPPGHHAENDQAMGFCLFNNVAVAAAHAIEKKSIERVLIIDWDVHHGNGTQHSFYNDPRVLYFSTHRYPFYPGTGKFEETGRGEGRGYTVNVPLGGGADDSVFESCLLDILVPVARSFNPDLIMVSAGFDTHRRDPLGGMRVTEEGFVRQAAVIQSLSEELCGLKVVYTLEGGYDLNGQAASVQQVVSLLTGKIQPPEGRLDPPDGFDLIIEKERECLGEVWPDIGGKA